MYPKHEEDNTGVSHLPRSSLFYLGPVSSGMTNTRAREMLDSGYRMPAPDSTPDEMYELMLRCWHYNPEDRPHFAEIRAEVDLLHSR